MHFSAVAWIVISIFICREWTVAQEMFDASEVDPNEEDYEGLGQFLALAAIFFQQVLMLGVYGIACLYSNLRTRNQAGDASKRFT